MSEISGGDDAVNARPITPRELAFRAAAMAAIAKHALSEKDRYRAELTDAMANGEKLMPADPAHPRSGIGSVIRQNTSDSARISDRLKFTTWIAEFYPDHTETELVIAPERMRKAVEFLRARAPELLTARVTVLPWAEAEVLKLTVTAGESCGPQGETDVPGVEFVPAGEGTIVVTPHRDALEVIARMVRERRLDIQTGEILAIEGNADDGG